MNKFNILKNIGIFFLIMLIYLVIITTFNYFEIISAGVLSVISFIFAIFIFAFSGFMIASKSEKKGYLSGLIMGLINMSLLFIISLILKCDISASIILYFLILLLSSTMGGMFGINFKKENE